MLQKMKGILPSGRAWKKMMLALVVFGVGVLAFCWGRHGAMSEAKANPPTDLTLQPVTQASHSDYGQRVVAYLYNNMTITREDLGEYLIARFGDQRLDFLINHRIIDLACKARNIVITDQMVAAELQQNLEGFKLTGPTAARDFQDQVLRRWGKTLYEWKEDVIRPKLALRELARPRVHVTEEDLQHAFEAHYGQKVECRMILLPAAMRSDKMREIYAEVQKDSNAFMKHAKEQAFQALAEKSGMIPPIHKYFADKHIEDEAFALKIGEVSGLIGLPDKSWAILRCEKLIARDQTKIYEMERNALKTEVDEAKLQEEIPKMFAEMQKLANPRPLLGNKREDLASQVQRELQPVDYSPRQTPPLLPADSPKK